MSEMTADGKLELVKQIREEYNRNMYDMSNREKILYGRTTRHDYDQNLSELSQTRDEDYINTAPVSRGLFRIRFLAATFFFLLLFTMRSKGFTIAGYSYEDICNAVSCDYADSIDAWIANGLQAPE